MIPNGVTASLNTSIIQLGVYKAELTCLCSVHPLASVILFPAIRPHFPLADAYITNQSRY